MEEARIRSAAALNKAKGGHVLPEFGRRRVLHYYAVSYFIEAKYDPCLLICGEAAAQSAEHSDQEVLRLSLGLS